MLFTGDGRVWSWLVLHDQKRSSGFVLSPHALSSCAYVSRVTVQWAWRPQRTAMSPPSGLRALSCWRGTALQASSYSVGSSSATLTVRAWGNHLPNIFLNVGARVAGKTLGLEDPLREPAVLYLLESVLPPMRVMMSNWENVCVCYRLLLTGFTQVWERRRGDRMFCWFK